jgi:hypothetical protein
MAHNLQIKPPGVYFDFKNCVHFVFYRVTTFLAFLESFYSANFLSGSSFERGVHAQSRPFDTMHKRPWEKICFPVWLLLGDLSGLAVVAAAAS